MCKILLTDAPAIYLHAVLTEDVIAYLQLSVFRRIIRNITAFRFQAALLQHHHHGYKTGQLERFRQGDITNRISYNHEAQRMLSEGNTNYRFGLQSLICFVFLWIGLAYSLCVRDDHGFLINQMLNPCNEFICHLKLMEKGLLHRTGFHIVPHFRTPQLGTKICYQNTAPICTIEFAGRLHNTNRNFNGIFNVVQSCFRFHNDFEKLILEHIPLVLFL